MLLVRAREMVRDRNANYLAGAHEWANGDDLCPAGKIATFIAKNYV